MFSCVAQIPAMKHVRGMRTNQEQLQFSGQIETELRLPPALGLYAKRRPGANGAKEDGLAIDFPEYLNGTAENAKNTVGWISLSEEDLPLCEVRASHCSPLNQQPVAKLEEGKLVARFNQFERIW